MAIIILFALFYLFVDSEGRPNVATNESREYTTYVNFGRKEVRAQSSLIQGEKIKIDGYLHRSGCTCDVYNM